MKLFERFPHNWEHRDRRDLLLVSGHNSGRADHYRFSFDPKYDPYVQYALKLAREYYDVEYQYLEIVEPRNYQMWPYSR